MEIKIIPCLKDNYSYLIFDKNSKVACVIDPGDAKPIIKNLKELNLKLRYILNTHHHFDHVGGNLDLKEKFNSEVIGYKNDQDRIPGIDILLEDEQKWSNENFNFQMFHIPGHTSGHVYYHFPGEKIAFTGDMLFSLGCGRVFECSHEQMFDSLKKIKNLPKDTMIYCGHEYTLQNSKFCIKYDPNNIKLKNKISFIKERIKKGLPTIPSLLQDEIDCNIFLKANDLKSFSKLRDLKDNF